MTQLTREIIQEAVALILSHSADATVLREQKNILNKQINFLLISAVGPGKEE